ncbi:hypothetical protein [Atopobacter phocae]|uniref:hypothetical protein n=1 Tax=Atopobacter phocae TaxID=136492 RepID=UPI00046EEE2B|nr:hypothetical protein [Atopobacter phocae]
MTNTVYTNYWISKRDGVKKEHGSYKTEEAALEGILAWWRQHRESYDYQTIRTNTGALEIVYDDENYVYRIEQREIDGKLPSTSYKLKSKNEIDSQRQQLNLDEETYLFDELAEPYRDRLVIAMADNTKFRNFVYTKNGEPIVKIENYHR